MILAKAQIFEDETRQPDRVTYRVGGMDCADCALKVEKGVRQLKGVEKVQVDFMTGLLQVEGVVSDDDVRKRVTTLGYRIAEPDEETHCSDSQCSCGDEDDCREADQPARVKTGVAASGLRFFHYLLDETETRLALIGGLLLGVGLLLGQLGAPALVETSLEIAALLLGGYPIARSGLVNLAINRDFNIDLLMTIAAVGAVIIGEPAEGASLVFLFAIAEAMEAYTTDRARSVLTELSELAPTHAVRIAAGRDEYVPVGQLQVGDRILVKPGERIPMDGQVVQGASEVDQAPITGESMPVARAIGDEVFAGSINGSGALEVTVSRRVTDSTISRVITLVELAQSVRAPVQRFIDRFAQIYTPVVVGVAVLVAVLPPLLFGQPFFDTTAGERGWFYRALALLVIACPCALVISAPVTILSAITAAARHGVLFKGGVFMETLSKMKAFAFDKTGTLTYGRPEVTQCRSLECTTDTPCPHCDEVLGLAYALEQRSTHPLARAVISAAEARGLDGRFAPAADVTNLAGRGLQGDVDGRRATIGSHTLFDAEYPHEATLCAWAEAAEDQGQTAMLVSDGLRIQGMIAVADTLRADSRQVVSSLRKLGAASVMLTGDNPTAARRAAEATGVDAVYAGLLPEQKVDRVARLLAQHGKVAMVGDGINDTPALAAASIGVTLRGAGSAQALETADVVLMGDDLHALPYAVKLSAFANRLIRENVAISLATKLVFVALALTGVASMWMAVVADMGVSLLVTTNGLRALRFKDEDAGA
jgi:Cd2+/Zn2+-exporting ATPase